MEIEKTPQTVSAWEGESDYYEFSTMTLLHANILLSD